MAWIKWLFRIRWIGVAAKVEAASESLLGEVLVPIVFDGLFGALSDIPSFD